MKGIPPVVGVSPPLRGLWTLGAYDWGQCGGDDRMLRWGVNVLDKLADIWYNTGRNGSLAQWI
jgi:hypothetical protein